MITFNNSTSKINNSSVNLFNPQKSDNTHLPLLIYLPGMDGTGELFHNQIPKLAPHFNVRCLSIPSTDLSNWQQLTIATINSLKQELSDNYPEQVYLCGESFGGCLSISVAVAAPQLFAGMILINPASSFNQQPVLSWGINLTRWIPEWLHSNSALGLLPFLAELNRIEKSDRKVLLKAMKSLSQEVVSWRLSLLQEFLVTPFQGKQFEQPTLIVAGDRDRLLPSVEEASKLIDIFPNSKMEVLPDSGHACLLEKEINLADILVKHDFLV
ncbi:Alpha/beta hydrolase fold protein [Hyella patelloides LEGE 07179]|uniref:Alpha/beta hydrolase fold protein n=1 Tax=Hyella patelloides LEGE 07179 TaxID=945734 RepID=A0A563VKD2_9CYAN|nr:alpha/beta hydrolase [Hyella patelloides]VEP11745.1 Alpha/beta hydrolase fold protein [Hyella patelloides LEGE 07179]